MSRTRPFLPILFAAAGIATFSLMDALMKLASSGSGVYAAWVWRSVLGALVGGVAWWWHGARDAQHRQWPGRHLLTIHFARATVSAAMAFLFFWGLVRTPMAVGMALSFIAPLIALYLAALTLGEPVTRRAVIASLLGLAGVCVICFGRMRLGVGHGGASFWGMLAILGSAVLYAGNLVLQRQQAQIAGPGEITFFQGLFIGLVMAPGALWLPAMPVAADWPHVVGSALLGSASLMLLAWAWGRAEAHRLLPMEYSAFVWAALLGWWWFGESLDGATVLGVALIVIGCWIGTVVGADAARPGHIEQTAL